MAKQTNELYDWHNHDEQDQPGVKIWWNQKYIARLIEELTKLQTNQNNLLEHMSKNSTAAMKLQQELVNLIRKMSDNQDLILSEVRK